MPTIPELIEAVEALKLGHGIENSLEEKLRGAQSKLDRGETGAACGKLGALVAELQALAGKKVPSEAAEELIADVEELRTSLGCPAADPTGCHNRESDRGITRWSHGQHRFHARGTRRTHR